jgi:hypothetical protein
MPIPSSNFSAVMFLTEIHIQNQNKIGTDTIKDN